VTARPLDLNSIPGYSGDYRTVDKLVDGYNVTTDDHHMWLIPFTAGTSHTIDITLSQPTYIRELKFYNYNKSPEDTFRGAKLVTISIDGKLMTSGQGMVLRKALGHDTFDYGQIVQLPCVNAWDPTRTALYNAPIPHSMILQGQIYEMLQLPTGFVFDLMFYSTYGDWHYVGLNGLEMYDLSGQPLLQTGGYGRSYDLVATPSSVRQLPGMEADTRTPDKLVDGLNETLDDRHMWLAPFMNTRLFTVSHREIAPAANKLTVVFKEQVALAALQLWNYSKTPDRGVQEFALYCDSRLVYRVIVVRYFHRDSCRRQMPASYRVLRLRLHLRATRKSSTG
jgi:hypothetical protein